MLTSKIINCSHTIYKSILSNINLKLCITIVSLYFVGYSIYGNLDALNNQNIGIYGFLWLVIGTVLSMLSIIVNGYAWKFLLENLGFSNSRFKVIKSFVNTNLYKYLPGGVWHLISRVKLLSEYMSFERALENVLLEPLLMLVAGLMLVSIGGWQSGIFLICLFSPCIFLPVLREWILTKIKLIKGKNIYQYKKDQYSDNRYFEKYLPKLRYPFKALFVEIVFLLVRFYGFWCCLNVFSIANILTLRDQISVFSFAWIVGLIVPAAPGGVGVFEAIILFKIGNLIPSAPLLASLLCYRLISTIADIMIRLIFSIVPKIRIKAV